MPRQLAKLTLMARATHRQSEVERTFTYFHLKCCSYDHYYLVRCILSGFFFFACESDFLLILIQWQSSFSPVAPCRKTFHRYIPFNSRPIPQSWRKLSTESPSQAASPTPLPTRRSPAGKTRSEVHAAKNRALLMYTSAVVCPIFLFASIANSDQNRLYLLLARVMLPFRCTACSVLLPDLLGLLKLELDDSNLNVLCQSKTLAESKFTSTPTDLNNSHGHLFRSRSSSASCPEKPAWLFIAQKMTRTRTSLALRLIMSLLTESVFF